MMLRDEGQIYLLPGCWLVTHESPKPKVSRFPFVSDKNASLRCEVSDYHQLMRYLPDHPQQTEIASPLPLADVKFPVKIEKSGTTQSGNEKLFTAFCKRPIFSSIIHEFP